MRTVLPPREHLAMSGDVWGHLSGVGGAAGIWWLWLSNCGAQDRTVPAPRVNAGLRLRNPSYILVKLSPSPLPFKLCPSPHPGGPDESLAHSLSQLGDPWVSLIQQVLWAQDSLLSSYCFSSSGNFFFFNLNTLGKKDHHHLTLDLWSRKPFPVALVLPWGSRWWQFGVHPPSHFLLKGYEYRHVHLKKKK